MLLVYDVVPEKRGVIPAVTHGDDTGRVQTVKRRTNAKLYDVLFEFEKVAGVPVLLNTSFNDRGQPS